VSVGNERLELVSQRPARRATARPTRRAAQNRRAAQHETETWKRYLDVLEIMSKLLKQHDEILKLQEKVIADLERFEAESAILRLSLIQKMPGVSKAERQVLLEHEAIHCRIEILAHARRFVDFED
jgi:hypothetical protein